MAKLQQTVNSFRGDRPPPSKEGNVSVRGGRRYGFDVNIEFAHVLPIYPTAEMSFKASYRLLCEYISACRRRGESFSVSILIDDKENGREATYNWINSRLKARNFRHYEVLYWGIESELRSYKKKLYAALTEENRTQIVRRVESYLDKHGALACSHDIAIWHLLRLGVISPLNSGGIRYRDIYRKLNSKEVRRFSARRIATILSDEEMGHETRSDNEILKYIKSDAHLLGRSDKKFYSTR